MPYCVNCGSQDTVVTKTGNEYTSDYFLYVAEDTGCSTECYDPIEIRKCNSCKETFYNSIA